MKGPLSAPPLKLKPQQAPITPYMKAQREWDNRIGQTVVQAKNWRVAFFSLAAISTIVSGGLVYQVSKATVVPMVITVNSDTGEPKVLGKVAELNYQPKLQEIKYFLSEFIRRVRAVPSDPVVVKKNWMEAYLFLRSSAATILNDMTNRDDSSPLKKLGDKTVTIQLLSINQVDNGNSYQARWSETVYARNGTLFEEYTMNGVFTVDVETPTDEKVLVVNPLGIFIKNFQWTRELKEQEQS